jgi:hypothetical protein
LIVGPQAFLQCFAAIVLPYPNCLKASGRSFIAARLFMRTASYTLCGLRRELEISLYHSLQYTEVLLVAELPAPASLGPLSSQPADLRL